MTILRSRLKQEYFGTCEEFDEDPLPRKWSPEICGYLSSESDYNYWPTICGDWMWRRPAIFQSDYSDPLLAGTIDIFGQLDPADGLIAEDWYSVPMPGIPYNLSRFPNKLNQLGDFDSRRPPVVRISAGERQYPMWNGDPRSSFADLEIPFDLNDRQTASYYWDCMFRRYQGRILVAIFVYRIRMTDEGKAYVVDTHDSYDTSGKPPHLINPDFPRHINLDRTDSIASTGSWDADDNGDLNRPESLELTFEDNPLLPQHQWQAPGQWIVDQNANIHRVQRGRHRPNDPPVLLASPPYEIQVSNDQININDPAPSNVNWWNGRVNSSGFVYEGVVTDIWFIPTRDTMGRSIVPVFATVQEL